MREQRLQSIRGIDPTCGRFFVRHNESGGGGNNQGTLFKVAPDGTGFTVIDSFACDGDDGCNPQAGLILANNGYLYGTTFSGGQYGGGTIFRFLSDMAAPDTTVTFNPRALSNSNMES